MNIAVQSELMENRKHAVVVAPDLNLEALQSQDGDALFFSIGTDNVFYLTREITETPTGWDEVDLSSALSSESGGAAVVAKAFAVAQNAQTLAIDLALVLTVDGADLLYLSLRNANTDAAWAAGVTWTQIPFDAGTAPSQLTIADVFVMNIAPAGGASAVENIFVDILRTPGDPLKLLDRYYITPGPTPQWNLHTLPFDLAAGSISSCLGQPSGDPVPGIYTFGMIGGVQELNFTPQYNFFSKTAPPSPARLTVPAGATAVASALDSLGTSSLFVSGADGLYVFTPDNQHDQATPVQVVPSAVTGGASTLAAAIDGGRTAVWGIGSQGSLFYVACAEGSEADSSAWSEPVPLLPSVESFAFYLNLGLGNSVLFANVDGQDLVQLTQDPVTTDWLQRSILLPPTATSDVSVYNSFTTHIQVTDDNGVGMPNAGLVVTSTSPVSVYVNDVYHVLSPSVAVNTTTDETGVLTVIQETQSLAAVCFKVVLTGSPAVTAEVNPMSHALATLGTVQSGPDLTGVHVTNADGTQQALLPTGVSPRDAASAAASLAQFMQVNAGLPADGSRQSPTQASRGPVATAAAARTPVWGLTFTNGHLEYYEGEDSGQLLALRTTATQAVLALPGAPLPDITGSSIEVAAGDFFHWLEQIYDDVESFSVKEIDGINHFFATIADEVYDVLLDCTAAVAHAVTFVFNRIGVFFEDLIKWLGFLFVWADIVRTHAVLKNIFNQYLANCIGDLAAARTTFQNAFTDVQTYVNGWAGLPNDIPPSLSASSLDGSTASSQPAPGQDSPQSNWGIYHFKSNAASATTNATPNTGVLGDIEDILQPLTDALAREEAVFEQAYTNFKNDIIDKIDELSFAQLLEEVIAIIADALLECVENVLLTAIDALTSLSDGIVDALNATVDIPVISGLYQEVAKDDLSLMDLVCLLAAIPITVSYKLIADSAPFPDDATTTALIDAPDFATIQTICNGTAALRGGVSQLEAQTAGISTSVNKILVLTGGIASAVGSILLCFLSPAKVKAPLNKIYTIGAAVSYFLYVAPDIFGQIPDLDDKKWWAIMNEIVCDIMCIKSLVDMGVGLKKTDAKAQGPWDMASPWVDFGANIIWQVPTTAALFDPENQNTAGILSYWGGTAFDCNGVMSPALADDTEPISWWILVGVATVFNLAYGGLSLGASILTFKS